MIGIKVVYIANIIVAGWISITSLFFPKTAAVSVFSGVYPNSELIRLVGALWFSIFLISILGLWKPINFSPILIVQLIYKSLWLLVVALPAILQKNDYPSGMASFFLIWVIVLPFVIPWKALFSS
ncbi:MAG: hypothetical protein AAF705_07090 [Bacteroidota bacterium]